MNRANPIEGRITIRNLCSEILQVIDAVEFNDDLSYSHRSARTSPATSAR